MRSNQRIHLLRHDSVNTGNGMKRVKVEVSFGVGADAACRAVKAGLGDRGGGEPVGCGGGVHGAPLSRARGEVSRR